MADAPQGAQSDPDEETIQFAKLFNCARIVDYLLAHGASKDARESRGMAAHELARAMGAEDTAAQLAE